MMNLTREQAAQILKQIDQDHSEYNLYMVPGLGWHAKFKGEVFAKNLKLYSQILEAVENHRVSRLIDILGPLLKLTT